MIQHKEHFHGSDLEKIEQIYGIKKEEITSLYRCQPGSHHCRERLHRADLFIHSDHASKKSPDPWPNLLRV